MTSDRGSIFHTIRRALALLLATAVPSLGSCRDDDGATPVSSAGSEDSEWLTVTADPSEIAKAEQDAARAEQDALEAIFTSLEESLYVDSDAIEVIKRHRPGSLTRLKDLVARPEATNAGTGGALVLCELRDAAGRAYAAHVLQSGDAEQRLRVLHRIANPILDPDDEDDPHRRFLFEDSRLPSGLLRQLDDENPDVVTAAIQTCGYLNLPGARERFLELLKRPDAPDRGRLLFWLSKGELTEPAFEVALKAANELPPDDPWGGTFFEAAARNGSPAVRARAKEHLRKKLADRPDDGKGGYHGHRLDLLATLSETATAEDLDWVRQAAARELGSYARAPLVAWIRLDPREGRKNLLKWLTDDERLSVAVAAAGQAYAGSGDEEIVAALASAAKQAPERDLPGISNALDAIGGPQADRALEALLPRLDAQEAAYLKRRREHVPPSDILAAAQKVGVLDAEAVKEATARLSEPREEEDSEPTGLADVFHAAGLAHSFDTETDMLPCRHDKLVLEMAAASRGKFAPRAVLETWHRKHDEDYEAPYTLQFAHGDRLYRAEIRNFGDWYDLERVLTAVNKALAEANLRERYVTAASDGQFATVLFADPAALAPLAERFHMPLSDDPEEARDKGIEYENYVKERLEQAE